MTNAARMLAFSTLCAACAQDVPPPMDELADRSPEVVASASAGSRIDVAMSGAPMAIAAQARIVELDASGGMVELRPGSNEWLCIVDDTPAAPGDSPDCLDERWQRWFESYAKGEAPRIDGIGVAYMLQGSLSPSNTDPLAVTPPPGADWMVDGPHMMIIAPDPAMLRGFPTDHGHGGPYVMYAGTPYAHLMVPVAPH
jgi:hypothetical protein